MKTKGKTGLQMLKDIGMQMAKKHRALKPSGNMYFGAGTSPARLQALPAWTGSNYASSEPGIGQGGTQNIKGARKGKKKSTKHRAMKPMGNNFMMAPSMRGGGVQSPDLGGTGPQEIAKTGLGQGGGFQGDWPYNKFARKTKRATKKLPHLKPKGKQGKAQVARLGRTFKTGGFNKIAASAGKKYGSTTAGKRVAGAIFNKMAHSRGHAARKSKTYSHKGHIHRSRKAMSAC